MTNGNYLLACVDYESKTIAYSNLNTTSILNWHNLQWQRFAKTGERYNNNNYNSIWFYTVSAIFQPSYGGTTASQRRIEEVFCQFTRYRFLKRSQRNITCTNLVFCGLDKNDKQLVNVSNIHVLICNLKGSYLNNLQRSTALLSSL